MTQDKNDNEGKLLNDDLVALCFMRYKRGRVDYEDVFNALASAILNMAHNFCGDNKKATGAVLDAVIAGLLQHRDSLIEDKDL